MCGGPPSLLHRWISVQEMGKGLQDVNKRLKVGVAGLTPAVKVELFIERKKENYFNDVIMMSSWSSQ